MDVDMHIHTLESDGTYTPEEIILRAMKNNVIALAITDHDTVAGVKAGKAVAERYGMEFIEGIEISCNEENLEVHVLGYYLNLEDEVFLRELAELEEAREKRNRKIIEKFEKIGIIIDIEELKKFAPGNIISRLHFANYLLEKGIVTNKNEAFTKYLGRTGLAYVPKENFSPERAVKMIKANGGFASLAHPKLISLNDEILNDLIARLKECGLDALESQYSSFSKAEKQKFRKLAKKYGLLITGGSDFHGDNREGVDIGDAGLEYSQFERIKRFLNK
ncbi:PHP domain-containing protein [Fusobacterium sp.]|uniref:PHP domain-containing protein n=1 Tax=Fusobacterium sp. TaxID=68766 RepID=UPI002637E811|nr:PHP domain-containing protein [Fusobacterium sp.]